MLTALPALTLSRLGVGLAQAVVLLFLREAAIGPSWPATAPAVFGPLLLAAVFLPPIVISGLGNLRPRVLLIWALAAIVLCAGLAFHGVARDPAIGTAARFAERFLPDWEIWFALGAILFILHSLVLAGDNERKAIGSYSLLFDTAWELALQYALSAGFVGALSLLLWLGAELFGLIGLSFLSELLKQSTFWIVVIALAFSYALHVTDVRAAIAVGARTLLLTLLSWLLPIFALVAVVFVAALPFTGLEPLWNTRRAAWILLSSAALLVILVNAAHQDGSPERRGPFVLRLAGAAAAAVLLPLAIIAGYALALRIGQHGWTPDRIVGVACAAILASYGSGYAWALLRRQPYQWIFERTNVACALAIVAVLLALYTPLADPGRISTADQVARLESGKVSPEQFDFAFLRFGAGRYGKEALEAMAQETEGPRALDIAARARQALDTDNRWALQRGQAQAALTPAQRKDNIRVVQPPGATLPEAFLRQDWAVDSPWTYQASCLREQAECEAVLTDLDGDDKAEILLFTQPGGGSGAVFKEASGGSWTYLGALSNLHCPGVAQALRSGDFKTVPPVPARDIEVNGQRLRVQQDCTREP